MTTDTTYQIQAVSGDRPLPPGVDDLLGHEVSARFDARDDHAAVVGAVEDGQWVAALLMLLEDAPTGDTVGSIRQLVVPPSHRGRGIAGRLIRRALQLAEQRGAARVRSTAGWGCPDHLAMYRRMKFDDAPAAEAPYLVTRPV